MISKRPSRLEVMMSIHHPEEYYQQALESQGIEWENLTHVEIATFVATIKAIEADIMIEISNNLPVSKVTDEIVDKVIPK